MDIINNFFAQLSNFLWGNFGVANLVIGGGVFFLVYSKLTPLDILNMLLKYLWENMMIQMMKVE